MFLIDSIQMHFCVCNKLICSFYWFGTKALLRTLSGAKIPVGLVWYQALPTKLNNKISETGGLSAASDTKADTGTDTKAESRAEHAIQY